MTDQDTRTLIVDFLKSGGTIKNGPTRKAKNSKTFKGRYTLTISGVGHKSSVLRNMGYSKSNGI
jgi:hypothetical protein